MANRETIDAALASPATASAAPPVPGEEASGVLTTRPLAQPGPTSLYFVNAWVDVALIGGISIVTYVLLRLLTKNERSAEVATLAAQLAWVCNWPHFSATNYRLYHSLDNIRQYPLTALAVPPLLLLLVIGSILSPQGVAPYLVKFFYLWSPYHFSGQTLGITLIYARRAGFQVGRWERLGLSGFIYGTFLVLTARSEVIPPGDSGRHVAYYGIEFPKLGVPAWLPGVFEVFMYLGAALFLALVLRWSRDNRRLLPLIILVPAAAQFFWFVYNDSWLPYLEFVPFFHCLQYLLIAWSMQLKEKMDQQHIDPSTRYVVSESLRWYVLNFCGGVILFFLLPRLLAFLLGINEIFATGVTIAAVQIHHFFVDGVIWKLKRKSVASPLMVNLSDMLDPRPAAQPA